MVSRATVLRPGARLAACALIAWGLTPAVAAPPTEHEVKAAYLFNFAKFTEWPAEAMGGPTEPFVIGVLGRDPIAEALPEVLRGAEVRGHPVVVENWSDVRDVRAHILFIGADESFSLPWVLRELEGRPLLTVGDADGFVERGGMVRFLVQDQRVRFEIDRRRAERAGLSMSSQLLRVARRVVD
jgi:hypothetical protein